MQTRLGGEICSSDVNMHIIRVMENLMASCAARSKILLEKRSLTCLLKRLWHFLPKHWKKLDFVLIYYFVEAKGLIDFCKIRT